MNNPNPSMISIKTKYEILEKDETLESETLESELLKKTTTERIYIFSHYADDEPIFRFNQKNIKESFVCLVCFKEFNSFEEAARKNSCCSKSLLFECPECKNRFTVFEEAVKCCEKKTDEEKSETK